MNYLLDFHPKELLTKTDIELITASSPPSRSAYRLSQSDLGELQRQLTALLEQGFIETSKSPFGAPVFFVKKQDGSLRLVCDWRDLNPIAIKNEACLPNIDEIFDTVQGSRYFTKHDLHSGYNEVHVHQEDIPKTAINTPLGHFEFNVMVFGLCNAPATFHSLMNQILRPYLRKFVIIFMDDILIFSQSWKELLDHVREVLQVLHEDSLFCKPKKCTFGVKELLYLGHRLSGRSIAAYPAKLAAVQSWPVPLSVHQLRSFVGFTNYFRRFINHFTTIFSPLEDISGKKASFTWTAERQEAFDRLKSALLILESVKRLKHGHCCILALVSVVASLFFHLFRSHPLSLHRHFLAYCSFSPFVSNKSHILFMP